MGAVEQSEAKQGLLGSELVRGDGDAWLCLEGSWLRLLHGCALLSSRERRAEDKGGKTVAGMLWVQDAQRR